MKKKLKGLYKTLDFYFYRGLLNTFLFYTVSLYSIINYYKLHIEF